MNGDKLNDVFKVGGVFVESFILKIFDRWGNKVFETTNMEEGWDGTINGKPGAPDVYVYIAEGRGRMNQIKVIEGNVTLLR
ncbi:MAG: gliding motility-associated C-terminal domain-containing protein [Bacteroidia bacterium]|nr:gliding motility-associated C-terminal domain-containing protein [Bacteroidia bacterium]